MRALRLKAEGNGGVDRKGRGHRRHPPTHTAPEGSLTSTREAKNINQFCPPPVLRKLNSCLINTDGGQNQRSSLGGQFFFFPNSLSCTNLWTQAQVFQFVPKNLFRSLSSDARQQQKKKKEGKRNQRKSTTQLVPAGC